MLPQPATSMLRFHSFSSSSPPRQRWTSLSFIHSCSNFSSFLLKPEVATSYEPLETSRIVSVLNFDVNIFTQRNGNISFFCFLSSIAVQYRRHLDVSVFPFLTCSRETSYCLHRKRWRQRFNCKAFATFIFLFLLLTFTKDCGIVGIYWGQKRKMKYWYQRNVPRIKTEIRYCQHQSSTESFILSGEMGRWRVEFPAARNSFFSPSVIRQTKLISKT